MRLNSIVLAAGASAVALSAACHSTAPVPVAAPLPLSDSAASALNWVQSNAGTINASDSVAGPDERARLFALASGARVIGFSEMVEGTHEFPYLIRRALFALADSGVRGIALQAPMAETMEIDRYVRGGAGEARRLLRAINPPESERIATRETIALVNAIRDWNRTHADRQIGVYGFEIPSVAHAVQTITNLPDSIIGAPTKAWLRQKYACVAMNEGAHFGLEGRAEDSTFWSSCGPTTAQAHDTVAAHLQRAGSAHARSELSFAETMARIVQHHMTVGLRHPARQEGNADHVMFLADLVGAQNKLMLWGGDAEMARLTLDKTTIQTGEALGKRLGNAYRAIGYTIGAGTVRARVPNMNARGPETPGFSSAQIAPPRPGTYEDVFNRATQTAYWLDMRALPSTNGGTWLKGPRGFRFIVEAYSTLLPERYETPISFPANFDAVVFVRTATRDNP